MQSINLKSGVMENILSSMYDVDPDIKYRQLNRQIYDESKLSFYNKNCDKLITNREIINYINTKPKKIGLIKVEEDEDEDMGSSTNIKFTYLTRSFLDYTKYTGEYNTISFILTEDMPQDYIVHNIVEDWGRPNIPMLVNMVVSDIIIGMDLLTMYHIYKNRGDCMRVNKNYAKNKVLNYLNGFVNNAQSFYKIYYLYEYLILNCFILDIPVKEYTELESLTLEFKEVLSLQNYTVNEVLDALEQDIEDHKDIQLYQAHKTLMMNEINKLFPIIDNYFNNL